MIHYEPTRMNNKKVAITLTQNMSTPKCVSNFNELVQKKCWWDYIEFKNLQCIVLTYIMILSMQIPVVCPPNIVFCEMRMILYKELEGT